MPEVSMEVQAMLKETMTSKERVLTTLASKEPDRVPINYHSNPGIDARLKEHFGLEPNDGVGLMNALGVDFRGVGAWYKGPRLHEDIPEPRDLAMHLGTPHLLQGDLLTDHHLRHPRRTEVHTRIAVDHDIDIAKGRDIGAPGGRRSEQYAYLRNDPREQ